MQSPLSSLLAVYALFATALGASLHIRISPTALLPNPANLPPSTHAVLTSEHGSTTTSLLRKDNSILFPEITTTGTHLLQIYTRDYTFANYRIDTAPDPANPTNTLITLAAETFLGTQWSDTGVSLLPRSATSAPAVPELVFAPKMLSQKQFYEDRPAFNALDLLKNPMILMGGVALIFTFGMPKLMENMDPEMKAEYDEIQKKSPITGMARAMQGGQGPAEGFDLAGYLAGKGGSAAKGADSIR